MTVCDPLVPDPPALPAPLRSLVNTIAREMLDGYDWTVPLMRRKLEDARLAVLACQSFDLTHGTSSLVDQIGRVR